MRNLVSKTKAAEVAQCRELAQQAQALALTASAGIKQSSHFLVSMHSLPCSTRELPLPCTPPPTPFVLCISYKWDHEACDQSRLLLWFRMMLFRFIYVSTCIVASFAVILYFTVLYFLKKYANIY